MKKIIILKGLPASGKSTWAKKQIDENPGMYKRINKDDLRAMLDNGKWSKNNESFILYARDLLVIEALKDGKHVIVDDTNLHPKHEKTLRQLAKNYSKSYEQVGVEVKEFNVSPQECIERDLKREKSVGAKVIWDMYNRFLKPEEPKDIYKPNKRKPPAYIFDIDGTLAKMINRKPYDWDRVGEDNCVTPVKMVLKALQKDNYKTIIFTGRDGVCKPETVKWLSDNGIEYDHFDIRAKDDTRKDSIVKREMFDRIKDDYHILGVFDDRDQVVKMWRELGLQCFQVNYGNF